MTGLIIDEKYYNALDIEGFSRMLSSPSYCYKFYWLEALVQMISANRQEMTYEEIIDEMIGNAWYSVLEYHLHLSGLPSDGVVKDNLEKAVNQLQCLSGLPNSASKVEIQNALRKFANQPALRKCKMGLTQNVPYKALSGFANRGEQQIALGANAGLLMRYYNKLSRTERLLPYTFSEESGLKRRIFCNDAWVQMIRDNTVPIMGWIQLEKVKWLQNNNPEVPGLVYKMAPMDEKLRKLGKVHDLWDAILEEHAVRDIFKGDVIDRTHYDVDHFIPWSFVMNDELWNLLPMDSSWNSRKSNKLPPWDRFFPAFAENQYILYESIYEKAGIHALYEKCYRDNLHSIWANRELYRPGNSKETFRNILEKNMQPVYDSARRQGYELWRLE